MMIFSSQVANIRVLQEKEIEDAWPQSFSSVDGKILFQGKGYIDVDRDNISFEESFADHFRIINDRFPFKSEAEKTYRRIIYPRHSGLYQVIGGELYLFHMHASGWAIGGYEKLHLISLRLVDNRWEAACELDISDCLRGEGGESAKMVRMVMKYINNRIIAYINTGSRDGSCVVVDVSSPSELKLIEKRPVLFDWGLFFDEQDKFAIPLVSIDGVDIKEKIQLSVDLYTEILINEYGEYRTSVVDIDGDRISFFHVSGKGIKRYDVIDWDDENVYCELSVERSFTILEQLIDRWCNRVFTKNGCDYGRGSCTTAELFCGTDL